MARIPAAVDSGGLLRLANGSLQDFACSLLRRSRRHSGSASTARPPDPQKMRVGDPKPPLRPDDDDNQRALFLVAVGSDALQQFEWLSYLWQGFDAELRFELRQLGLLQFLPLFQQILC